MSFGSASWSLVGLLSGKIIGRSTCFAISLIISSVKVFGTVEVPMRTCGLTSFTTVRRSSCFLPFHSSSSRAYGLWAGVSLSPWDLRSSPGLSTHLAIACQRRQLKGRKSCRNYQICFAASSFDLSLSVAIASLTWSAIPVPAVPDPKITTLISVNLSLLTCKPAIIAARVTHPVPWISSLKQAMSGRYLFSNRLALGNPKSSLWRR